MVGQIQAVLATALIAVGCFFLTVGTIGLLRFPNVYNRMHATSKPTTLGTAAIFLAGSVYFWPGGAGFTSLLGIVFLLLTVPTGAHMIARSAERMGVPFEGSVTWPALPGSDETESPEEGGRTTGDGDGDEDEGGDGDEDEGEGEVGNEDEDGNGDESESADEADGRNENEEDDTSGTSASAGD